MRSLSGVAGTIIAVSALASLAPPAIAAAGAVSAERIRQAAREKARRRPAVAIHNGARPQFRSPARPLSCATPCTSGAMLVASPQYEILVDCDGGELAVMTGAGHPVTLSSGRQSVLFDAVANRTGTDTSIFVYGDDQDFLNALDPGACSFDPADTAGERRSLGVELEGTRTTPSGAAIAVRHEVVAFGASAADGGVRLTQTIENTGSQPVDVGLRWLLDLHNADDDSPTVTPVTCTPFSSGTEIVDEHELTSAEVDEFLWVRADSGAPQLDYFLATSPLAAVSGTATPNRLVYGWFGNLARAPWDVVATEGDPAAIDSVLLYYFGAVPTDALTLVPGAAVSRSVLLLSYCDQVSPVSALAITKSVAPPTGPHPSGTTLRYTVLVENLGGADASDVEVWDCLDPLWDSALVTPRDGGVLGLLPNPGCPGDWIRWPVLTTVAAQTTAGSYRFDVELPPGLADGTALANVAQVLSMEEPAGVDSNEVAVTVAAPTIDATLSASPVPPAAGYPIGTTVTLTLDVTNSGGADASALAPFACLDGALPAAVVTPRDGGVLNQAPDPGCSSGQWVRWPTVASFAAGAAASFRLEIVIAADTPDQTGYGTSAAAATREQPAPPPVSIDITVCAPVLSFAKTLPAPSYAEGEAIEWTMALANSGSCPATDLELVDDLDLTGINDLPALTWSGPAGAIDAYDMATGRLTWTLALLASGVPAVFTVTSTVRAGTTPGPVCNSASVTFRESSSALPSMPAGGACADVMIDCAGIGPVGGVLAVRPPGARDDVRVTWDHLAPADDYNVWRASADKSLIPVARWPGGPGIAATCTGAMVATCTDAAAAPGTGGDVYFYQVRGTCDGTEGL